MGDEIATATTPSNDTAVPPVGANGDFPSQIFGGVPTNSGPAPSVLENKQMAIEACLDLAVEPLLTCSITSCRSFDVAFRSNRSSRTRSRTSASNSCSTTCLAITGAGYTAYETNRLKVSLRPQVSAARPSVVLVTARSEATGSTAVTRINF